MTEHDRDVLSAAMDRILPGGTEPGATTAHAIAYAEWFIQQDAFLAYARCFRCGLDLLEETAMAVWGKGFAACSADQRDAVLRTLEPAPHRTVQRFFLLLLRLTLGGFLCSPSYGGNRGGVGWRHIEFDPHPLTAGSAKSIGP